jgi:hypothetical protein
MRRHWRKDSTYWATFFPDFVTAFDASVTNLSLSGRITSTLKGVSENYGKTERFLLGNRLTFKGLMKAKLLIITAIAALCVTTPAFAKHRVVRTRNGQAVVVNTHRHDSRSSRVFGNVGIGFPFYGGYYGGYPYYGGYYSGYPYYGSYYSGGYPYGNSYYPYGYNNNYYSSSYPYSDNRYSYRNYDSVVIRVQERLARTGYYRGPIDGVIGPRTRYALQAYERNHGLPADGIIDARLLRTMGLA